MATVTIDTINPHDPFFVRYLSNMDIRAEVIDESGPAGGNPVVRYSGSREAIESMVDSHFANGDEAYTKSLIEG